MAHRWMRPAGKLWRNERPAGYWQPTAADAMADAVEAATGLRRDEPTTAALWRNLEKAGWKIECDNHEPDNDQ